MSLPLGIAALGAVGVIGALTFGESAKDAARRRIMPELFGAGPQRVLETKEAVRPCPGLSRCSWDKAIASSYERCKSFESGEVSKVCTMTTDGFALGGEVVAKVYNAISGLF